MSYSFWRRPSKRHSAGLTLIELMLSMLLGLIVTGGAISIVVANKQSYRTNEALSQVQESARTAFELLARDVRQAGVTGCDNSGRVANVLDPGATPAWWQSWGGITGYDDAAVDPAVAFGTTAALRVSGTDSIQMRGIQGTALSVETHDPSSANIKISAATTEIAVSDILMVCDFDHAAILQVSNYNSSNVTLVHNTGNSVAPGNCSKGLGFPTDCASATGNVYTFAPNSQIAKLSAVDWYIGYNGRPDEGGRSLYRQRLGSGGALKTEEVVAGVSGLQIRYLLDGTTNFVDASAVALAAWASVNAVSITLVMDSADRNVSVDSSVNAGRIQRTFTHIVTLRNRVP